jgi:hypothetical protein
VPSIDIKVVFGAGIILILVGIALAQWAHSGIWATFCILLGIGIILLGIGQKITLYLGLCFLGASLVFLGLGLAPLLG